MPRTRWPHSAERQARRFRSVHAALDREPVGRYERAGFGDPRGFRGEYARRPAYRLPRGVLEVPRPEGSGWPYPVREIGSEEEDRHLRAFRDRDLARAVDFALYNVIGREADGIAVYASDAVITLAGRVAGRDVADDALDTAWAVPGVRRVRSRLRPYRHLR